MTLTDSPRPAVGGAGLDALLVRAASGDCDAFADFYDATSPRVYAMLVSLTHDESRAASLLEDIYVEAWERMRGRPAPPCPGLEWMAVIAHRHAAGRP
jgi:RNA polymerase sigma-70 factor (ECF subfamily)